MLKFGGWSRSIRGRGDGRSALRTDRKEGPAPFSRRTGLSPGAGRNGSPSGPPSGLALTYRRRRGRGEGAVRPTRAGPASLAISALGLGRRGGRAVAGSTVARGGACGVLHSTLGRTRSGRETGARYAFKISRIRASCNSPELSHFAAFFLDRRAKVSVAISRAHGCK